MRAGPWILSLGLIQACSANSFVGLPADAAKLETIVLSYVEASVRHTVVYGRGEPILAEGTLESVVLLGWARSPEDLRLRPGAATGAAAGASCHAVEPEFALTLNAGGSWEPLGEDFVLEPELLDQLVPDRHPRCTRCPDFVNTRVLFPGLGRANFATRLDSGRLLVAHASITYLVSRTEAVPTNNCPLGGPVALSLGGGRYLHGGSHRVLTEFTIDEATATCTVLSSTAAPRLRADARGDATVMALAGPDPSGAVYLVVGDGDLFRFHRPGFEHLARLEQHPYDQTEHRNADANLVHLGPEDVAFHVSWKEVARWTRGSLNVETIPFLPFVTFTLSGDDRLVTLSHIEGLGLLAGDVGGRLYAAEASWGHFTSAPVNDGVGAIRPYAGGFVASVQNGLLWRWHEELGSCRTPYKVAPSQGGKGRFLYATGDDLVVADVEGDTNVAGAVNWLDLRPRVGPGP